MNVGRVRRKLAAMLVEHGFKVDPADLDVNYGYNTKNWDCCSWCAKGVLIADGFGAHLYSWSPMSELVRKGFTILQEDRRDFNLVPVGGERQKPQLPTTPQNNFDAH